jgi:SAM-dependent methyltransferase
MATAVPVANESDSRVSRPAVSKETKGLASRKVFLRLFSWLPSHETEASDPVEQDRVLTDLEKENEWLKQELRQFRGTEAEFAGDGPVFGGTGYIGEIVPPIAGSRLRAAVGSPSLAGHLKVADAWQSVLSRFLRQDSTVLDMGCGCGKDARNLIYHPFVRRYIGFDVYRPNIDWCVQNILPRAGGRFEFHYLDVYSQTYNPEGMISGKEVVFPAGEGEVDFAFGSSLFTHLLEPDAAHYLREVKRVLAPGGHFLPTIHKEPAPGTNYSGNEIRIDVAPEYFIRLAQDAGLRLLQPLGSVCGQEAFLFTAD